MRHLLVTNDYPPKFGGIQNYLWELYRRLPAEETVVLTRPYPGYEQWDAAQDHRIIRTRQPLLLPEPWLAKQINQLVEAEDIDLVMYDPAVPVGALGPRLDMPYGVILHGAEVTVPGRLPASRSVLGEVLRKSALVVTAGDYSTQEAERAAKAELPVVVIPPGVDCDRFVPLDQPTRLAQRQAYGLTEDDLVVLTLSRLVPRKGMDKLIDAAAALKDKQPNLVVLVAGTGRDRARLERRAASSDAPVRFLGRVDDNDVPSLYGLSDVFAMLCRVRWGGLEQEGFGIVFLEAAAAGVPQIAGNSGGAAEAVVHDNTGFVVQDPTDVDQVVHALDTLASDAQLRQRFGESSRLRASEAFSYDLLAKRFHTALLETVDGS